MNAVQFDAAIDLLFGALIVLSILLMMVIESNIGLAFGIGVFVSYALHVAWKMSQFDPEWMTKTIQDTVEETVSETVKETVSESVEETVSEQVDAVQSQVDAVEERVERRPREDEVEQIVKDATEE